MRRPRWKRHDSHAAICCTRGDSFYRDAGAGPVCPFNTDICPSPAKLPRSISDTEIGPGAPTNSGSDGRAAAGRFRSSRSGRLTFGRGDPATIDGQIHRGVGRFGSDRERAMASGVAVTSTSDSRPHQCRAGESPVGERPTGDPRPHAGDPALDQRDGRIHAHVRLVRAGARNQTRSALIYSCPPCRSHRSNSSCPKVANSPPGMHSSSVHCRLRTNIKPDGAWLLEASRGWNSLCTFQGEVRLMPCGPAARQSTSFPTTWRRRRLISISKPYVVQHPSGFFASIRTCR